MLIKQSSRLQKIDRIYAKLGIVHIQLKQQIVIDGVKQAKVIHLTPGQAATRACLINRSLKRMPPWHRQQTIELIETIIKVAREALHQQESPDANKTEYVSNLLKGLTGDGKDPSTLRVTEDALLRRYSIQFYTLDKDDIRAILRDGNLDTARKEKLMAEVHRQNMSKGKNVLTGLTQSRNE